LARCGNFDTIYLGIASIGFILYFFSSNKDSAANPKKVWNTYTVLPSLSLIPLYEF
jgi:hypothetical protein